MEIKKWLNKFSSDPAVKQFVLLIEPPLMPLFFTQPVSVCNLKLSLRLPVCVGHSLFLIAQTGFGLYYFIVKQLVQPLPDQVPRAH